ncbi:MAG: hypothetical protein K2I81_03430 [Alphaproteobacteria bacterium]|nr:hypothetical protein [Alphaproteobacteria bacterium]
MKKIFVIFAAGISVPAIAAMQTTCLYRNVYTSCNAGYYLSGGLCSPCPVGTYKANASAATECTQCPSSGGVTGTTKNTGAKTITECYIPAGTNVTDSTGIYQYTGDCYYSN